MVSFASFASNVLLFGLIFGMAGTVDLPTFRARWTDPRGIVTGVLSQFVLLPALGFAAGIILDLDPVARVALLVTTTAPGGGFSGLMCSLCNADLALSVAMTTASSILCVAAVPANLLIYLRGIEIDVPWASLIASVGVVGTAVLAGLALGHARPLWKPAMNGVGTVCGILNIGVAALASGGSSKPFWEYDAGFVLAIGSPCAIGLCVAFAVAKFALALPAPHAVAIAIECSYQNTALAIALVFCIFAGTPDASYAATIPLIYGGIEPLFITPFCLVAWKMGWTYARASVPFIPWLVDNWQPRPALRMSTGML